MRQLYYIYVYTLSSVVTRSFSR